MQHRTRILFLFLAFAAGLSAADPFVGTWKLNPAKTKYTKGMAPIDQTVTYSEDGSDFDVMVKGTSPDGNVISVHFTVPATRGNGKIIEAPYDGVSGSKTNANERDISFTKGGNIAYMVGSKLSAKGKILTVSVRGTNPAGQTVDGTNVYDRQ